MAVVTATHYFSNSIIGVPTVGADINVYDVATSPKYAVGFGFTRADGNKYRYAQFGAALQPGWIYGPNRTDGSAVNLLQTTCGNTSTAATAIEYPIATNQIGSHYIQVTSLTAVAQQYNGGYAVITTGPGAGCTYRIKNTMINALASQSVGTNDVLLELWEPLKIALTTASTLAVTISPYNDLLPCAGIGTATGLVANFPAGICVSTGASGSYGWVLTHGVTGIQQDGTIPSGTTAGMATLSSSTSGFVGVIGTSNINNSNSASPLLTSPLIGMYMNAASVGQFSTVYVTLE